MLKLQLEKIEITTEIETEENEIGL